MQRIYYMHNVVYIISAIFNTFCFQLQVTFHWGLFCTVDYATVLKRPQSEKAQNRQLSKFSTGSAAANQWIRAERKQIMGSLLTLDMRTRCTFPNP